jgi:hypothetical protein
MNRLLSIGILIASMLPFYAGAQQPNAANLQTERTELLDFHAVGGDKWATVHGWLYHTGRVKD